MTGTGKTRQMDAAIEGLMTCRTIGEAAAKAGVSKRTLQRWMKHEGFKKQYGRAKAELLEGTINRLRSEGWKGVEILSKIAGDNKTSSAARVSAASRLLETLMKAVEIQDLQQRLDALERGLAK